MRAPDALQRAALEEERPMPVYELDGIRPRIAASAWIAPSAQVIGNVELGEDVSVWFGAVVRGDHDEPIRVGRATNLQDNCVLHADPGKPLSIGPNVTVGHKAMLHGCTVGEAALIGIGAVVLNEARIGPRCLIGAGALVTEGKVFPEGSLIVGAPAVVKRPLTPEEIAGLERSAERYVRNARRFREGLTVVG
jgi:carbonic anhydrase/acetyltransferase-like protein (isoleucine patch superfamily)